MTDAKPYLSVVVASRNDDHGGEMLRRMQLFVGGLDWQAKRHGIDVELVVVEWNPPLDRPSLRSVLPGPKAGGRLKIRYIIVPNAVHVRWPHADRYMLFQWMAKNVGIRRASGYHVLCTNLDVLFSDGVCERMRPPLLREGVFYRAVFNHVSGAIMELGDVGTMIAAAPKHLAGRLGAKYRDDCVWHRYPFLWRLQPEAYACQGVDDHACGDFTLMSKKDWMDLRGYPELPSNTYVDGLICHAAAATGRKQALLPEEACVYHLAHSSCWSTMPVLDKLKYTMEHPGLDYAVYVDLVRWMRDNRQPLPVNSPTWGCADDSFDEHALG